MQEAANWYQPLSEGLRWSRTGGRPNVDATSLALTFIPGASGTAAGKALRRTHAGKDRAAMGARAASSPRRCRAKRECQSDSAGCGGLK
jgi:hypothetical protein